MEFIKQFDITVQHSTNRWKIDEGRWRDFVTGDEESSCVIHGKCAGILIITDEDRAEIEKMVDKILPKYDPDEVHEYTTLITHDIEVQGAKPI